MEDFATYIRTVSITTISRDSEEIFDDISEDQISGTIIRRRITVTT
jgi:hypothetical protein